MSDIYQPFRFISRSRRIYGLAAVLTAVTTITLMAQPPSRKSTQVIVAPVKLVSDFGEKLEALGSTRANESVDVTANITEFVRELRFEDGDRVRKGDVLVVLEKDEEESALKSARALYDERKASFERAKELVREQAVSTATLEERVALLRQIEGTIEGLEAQIRDRVIKAPFDGILGLRAISEGSLVRPGDVITTIDDLSRIKVDFEVPSVFLPLLKPGLPVSGRVAAYPDMAFTGNVATVGTRVDPATRTVAVRAHLPNEGMLLRQGLLMSMELVKRPRSALIIPEGALLQRGTSFFVYAVEARDGGSTAREKEVAIGARVPGFVEVTEGLSEGEQVVVHGLMQVRDGAGVEIRGVMEGGEALIEFTGDELRNNGAM